MPLDKRRREPTFAEIAAGARKTAGHPLDGRHHKRVLDDGAWDEEGRYWERQQRWLGREDVERLLSNAVLVVLHNIDGAQWHSGPDGRALWRGRLSSRFIEDNTVKHMEAAGWPDKAVYSAEMRSRPDSGHLLWFEEHC